MTPQQERPQTCNNWLRRPEGAHQQRSRASLLPPTRDAARPPFSSSRPDGIQVGPTGATTPALAVLFGLALEDLDLKRYKDATCRESTPPRGQLRKPTRSSAGMEVGTASTTHHVAETTWRMLLVGPADTRPGGGKAPGWSGLRCDRADRVQPKLSSFGTGQTVPVVA
jgi:hypothetical protein